MTSFAFVNAQDHRLRWNAANRDDKLVRLNARPELLATHEFPLARHRNAFDPLAEPYRSVVNVDCYSPVGVGFAPKQRLPIVFAKHNSSSNRLGQARLRRMLERRPETDTQSILRLRTAVFCE